MCAKYVENVRYGVTLSSSPASLGKCQGHLTSPSVFLGQAMAAKYECYSGHSSTYEMLEWIYVVSRDVDIIT